MRRNNLVEFFLNEYEADKYMSTHLYGAIAGIHNAEASLDDASDIFNTSAALVLTEFSNQNTFDKKQWVTEKELQKMKKKMTPFETYIALLKGYCAISILIMPKAFLNGGWAASMGMELVAAAATTICALKLVQAGLKYKLYSYSLIVEKALGKKGRVVLDIMIAATQFSFTVSHMTFIVESSKTTIDKAYGVNSNPWIYAAVVICILTPIAWERNIAKFAFTFLIGILLILLSVIVVSFYCFGILYEKKELGPGIEAINTSGYLTTLGMTIYSFEGIGVVMPIMHACECPERFASILTYAIVTLVILYIVFSELCYLSWGTEMDKPIVTEMLPGDKTYVVVTKFLVCVNLLCSYPIMINPANKIFEKWVFRCKNLKKKSRTRYWFKNFQRFLVVFLGAYMAVELASKIDKFLGLLGALLCAPLALFMPALLHWKLIAKTRSEKFFDFIILVVSLAILIFSTQ